MSIQDQLNGFNLQFAFLKLGPFFFLYKIITYFFNNHLLSTYDYIRHFFSFWAYEHEKNTSLSQFLNFSWKKKVNKLYLIWKISDSDICCAEY